MDTKPQHERCGLFRRIFRVLCFLILGGVLLVMTLWSAAALYIDVRIPWLRAPLAIAYFLGLVSVAWFLKGQLRRTILVFVGFAIVLCWWLTLKPSNEREWLPDLAKLAY